MNYIQYMLYVFHVFLLSLVVEGPLTISVSWIQHMWHIGKKDMS